ncbi:MAG: energy transducer TonB [Bacteroidia bacterium]
MKIAITLVSVFLLIALNPLNAQVQTQIKYYKDKELTKEVPRQDAKYVETTFLNADSLFTTEVKEFKSGKLIFKIDEPTGVERIRAGNKNVTLNYNFKLNYTDTICTDSISKVSINNILRDDNSIDYIAPKIATGEKTIIEYLQNNIYYPADAADNNIQGRVYVMLTINKSGNVEKIAIKKGTSIILDKEAARVFREIRFSNPATLNGVPQSFCIIVPVVFKLM